MSSREPRVRPPNGSLCRPGYETDRALAAADLCAEQTYRVGRIRRHRRYLHGWGIICGLWVVAAPTPSHPWRVRVCPGYGTDPRFREILLGEAALIDLAEHAWSSPTDPVPDEAFLGVQATERALEPIPSPRKGCDCPGRDFVDSRIEDALRFRLLWSLPPPTDTAFDFCESETIPCPDCPEVAYLPLACILLPSSEGDPITQSRIDNDVAPRP